MRKVFPFLKVDYFTDSSDQAIFNEISSFINKYNECPSHDALTIQISNSNLPEHIFENVESSLAELQQYEPSNMEWLVDQSEKFCKDKSVYNAILRSIQIIDGKDTTMSEDGIPSILQEALAVCFDTNIGHDYLESAESRWEFYHKDESRLPFDIDLLNKITNGGLPNKVLTCFLASTGVGKSLVMCHMATANLREGKNVLYITAEMAEERIAERIDANLLNVSLSELKDLPKAMFESRIEKIRDKTQGKLIIKEYPTAAAHAGHFEALLNELSLKKNFKPDVIYIDYLNICASSRYRAGNMVNSYTLIKSIAEELRGLAVKYDLPIITATQTNRNGANNSDIDITDTSESFGLPATVDVLLALVSTEELENQGQLMIKQLKNRFGDPNQYKRFVVGIDRSKMKLYNLDIAVQKDISDSGIPSDDIVKPKTRVKADYSSINV